MKMEHSATNNRNHAFDLLCGICILRMVMLHIMEFCGKGNNEIWTHVMTWTYYFMSFFFFKAGYFNKGTTLSFPEYLHDRIRRLLIPYLCAGTLGNLIYFAFLPQMVARYHKPIEPLSLDHIWQSASFYGNPPVWFLFVFFAVYLFVYVLRRYTFLCIIIPLFPAVSYLCFRSDNPLWFHLDSLFMGTFCFFLGSLWHRAVQRLDRNRLLTCSLLMLTLFILVQSLWPSTYSMHDNTFSGSFWNLWFMLPLILCGLSGFLLSLSVPHIPLLCHVGQHSMVYFICHYPMLYFYKFTHLSFGHSIYGNWDDVLILLPVLFICCSYLVPFVERIPWLSGRWPTTNK